MSLDPVDPLRSPRWQWWLVVLSGALSLVCGTIGVAQYEREHVGHVTGLSPFYHAVQMLILHLPHFDHGWNPWIEAGRWFGVLTLFGATLALLWVRFRGELMLLRVGTWSDHAVVCGLGRKGFELARCLKQEGAGGRVVVVDPHPDPELAARCAAHRIGLVTGDATTARALELARVGRARQIVVVTPSDETNVRIASEIRAARAGVRGRAASCHVHLSDIHLREVLQQVTESDRRPPGACALRFFDVFDNEARRVLLGLPLDGAGIRRNDPRTVHIAILGFGRMGRSLALRAAKMGHFANGKPLRLSVVDRASALQRERFLFRYPVFARDTVCRAAFHAVEAESCASRQLIEQWVGEPETLLHLFVCLSEDARTLEVALRLRAMLQGRPDSSLLVRAHTHQSLAGILDAISVEQPRLVPFGTTEDRCSLDAVRREYNEPWARAIHEQFVLSRRADSARRPEDDPALRSWDHLREDLRESNRQQADHLPVKLRAIDCRLVEASSAGEPVTSFSDEEVEVLAQMEHARWNAERWIAGWSYAPEKDPERRLNPNLVSWAGLTGEIRGYDRATVRLIPRLVQAVGQKICRLQGSSEA
jgi:hypothetical protein